MILIFRYFFFHMGFLPLTIHDSRDNRVKGKVILTPLYPFTYIANIVISWVITAGRSPLHVVSEKN